jgi:hypothetical protein
MHAQPLYIESKMKTKPCEINKASQSPDRVFLWTGNAAALGSQGARTSQEEVGSIAVLSN